MFQLEYASVLWSSRQNQQKILAVGRYLLQEGLQSGQVLVLLGSPTPVYIWSLCAAWSLGALVLPLNPRLSEQEIHNVLLESGASHLISDRPVFSQRVHSIPWCPPESLEGHDSDWVLPALEQPVTLIRTSGSSGRPKLAMHAWGNHYYSALGSAVNIDLNDTDRWLLSLPLYHVGGIAILVRTLLAEATLCIPTPEQKLPEALVQFCPTHLSLVPTQLNRLLQNRDNDANLLNCAAILLGGSALPTDLIGRAYALGLSVFSSYGSTEMSSQITASPPNSQLDELFTAGYVLPHRELRVTAEGEIEVRGKTLFMGYFGFSKLEQARNSDGWFATRDRGTWSGSKGLTILGRMDHMFISGGENIQPEEIESLLLAFPGVIQALVVPISDAEYGQRPLAFVEGDSWTENALKHHLQASLPGFKIPDYILAWPAENVGLKTSRGLFSELAQAFIMENKDLRPRMKYL